MGNYLAMATQQQIAALLGLGWSQRRIARELDVDRETVARYARLAAADPPPVEQTQPNLITGSETADQSPPQLITGSLPVWRRRLAPISGPEPLAAAFHEQIMAGLERGLTAQRIWQDLIDEQGYGGGYLTIQRYTRRLRHRHPEVADHLEHPPGEESQVDYFKSPAYVRDAEGRRRRPWVFRMTLSCSKHGYEEAMLRQTREAFLRAHEHAFAAFGGVVRVVRHDNLKAAVVRACLYDPDLSEVYEAFAAHWGFVALPSRPYHPQEQGVEERSGGYVKSNALKGREFEDLDAMNGFLRSWNRRVAAQRIHGSTRRQVLAHFLEVEQPALQPLPAEPFSLFEVGTRTVHPDGFIEVDGAYYTAPHTLVGQRVRVRFDEHLVRISHGGIELRVHARQARPGTWTTHPADRPAHKPARQAAFQANLLARAERIGAGALSWAQAAISERDVRAYRLLQGMLALTRRHAPAHVDAACAAALAAGSFRYRSLRRLVEEADLANVPVERLLTQEHPVIRPLREYAQFVVDSSGGNGP